MTAEQEKNSKIQNSKKANFEIKIIKQINELKKTLKPDEIATSVADFNPKKTKLIEDTSYGYGYMIADFTDSEITNLGTLEIINGGADFRNSKIKDLVNLKIINGNAHFNASKIENLGNLTIIGGTAHIGDSLGISDTEIKDLGNLTAILSHAKFMNSQVENLGNLTTIIGYADFRNTQFENLKNLSYVGSDIYANGNKLTKEQVEQHIKKINEINIIKKGLYYFTNRIKQNQAKSKYSTLHGISNGEYFIMKGISNTENNYKHFFIRDLKFNDNGTIAVK
jgi:hypothetical protein